MKNFMIVLLSFITLTSWAEFSDKSCENYLKHLDKNEYSKTWKNAAKTFQKTISEKQWIKSLEAVRTPLGKNFSRKKISKELKYQIPGAPSGEYMIYKFKSQFANKNDLIETITFVKIDEKSWKLVGYFIK